MKAQVLLLGLLMPMLVRAAPAAELGLPPVPVPADNPQSDAKIALGDKLFRDKRFSSTGQVACSTCHDSAKGFTDSPLKTSEGVHKARGTRNAPTVANAAYFDSMFWDGREPTLERQATQPLVNPIEMALPADYAPLLKLVRSDPEYVAMFQAAFGKSGQDVQLDEVVKAIAAFERTLVYGNSPFDRWYYGGDKSALAAPAQRGFALFTGQGRCVSCHTISQSDALFTDNRFHNLNVGFQRITGDVNKLANDFSAAKTQGTKVDTAVLDSPKVSELGRFAVDDQWTDIGAFKTPTLRNVDKTAPYMHDGSLATLKDVVNFYNNGGKVKTTDPVNGFQSGGIRPLNLSEPQKADLVAFLKSLTSPRLCHAVSCNTGGSSQ